MRGNLILSHRSSPRRGTIPAHAGEPIRPVWRKRSPRDYPRACGGTWPTRRRERQPEGLSPRMRGNRTRIRRNPIAWGTIPAHAGEPLAGKRPGLFDTDYPRACGGTSSVQPTAQPRPGLSPRMRGNQLLRVELLCLPGTIPAHAGEPNCRPICSDSCWDYPRACGGTVPQQVSRSIGQGLSPRMRGNLRAGGRKRTARGTIPAHAGEPRDPGRG